MSIRLVLADDHPLVLDGLRQLFERHEGFEVLSCCLDGDQALEAVRRLRPDVLVLDLRMPRRSGLDVLQAISDEKLACRPVVLTAALDDQSVVRALQLGMMGLVLKESPSESLIDCVKHVHEGAQWLDREKLASTFGHMLRLDSVRRESAVPLTSREIEIVRLVATGLRNRDIAERLSITEGTVKIHLHNAYEKLGVNGRLELVLYAQERGLLQQS